MNPALFLHRVINNATDCNRRRLTHAILTIVVVFMPLTSPVNAAEDDEFPAKPIKLIVYMKPGGLIDVTARKFVSVAAKYTDATFVVENKHGAGGIVAMQKVQRAKADGYMLLACTKSNISKVVSCDVEPYLANFHWLAQLMADPECVITHRKSHVSSWQELLADARSRPGEQLWLGPENGGLDHVTALKIWEAAGMQSRWVPCSSGGEARGKLLGQQGLAYVGNPSETLANPDLLVAAVCSAERLPQFPDAPTFRELGVSGLENETMWRGFAIKKGVPPQVVAWYEDLIAQVSADPDWKTIWEKGGIDVRFERHEVFSKIVEQDRQDYRKYLARIGLIESATAKRHWLLNPVAAAMLIVIPTIGLSLANKGNAMHGVIVGTVVGCALVCLGHTFTFSSHASVGPATIPRLYGIMIVVVSMFLWVDTSTFSEPDRSSHTGWLSTLQLIGTLIGYWLLAIVIGYILATILFLTFCLYRLGIRRWATIGLVTFAWIAIAYVIFVRLLFVPLPNGIVWEALS